jgi:NADH-quinone oxidoreductase subunit C
MVTVLNINDLSARLKSQFVDGVGVSSDCIEVAPAILDKVASYLKDSSDLDFNFLDMVAAADYPDHFELIYRLLSLKNKTLVSLRVKCDRDKPSVPSVASLWQGARLQEREIYDLFGIEFTGHPDLRRIVLWEGYEGHPLRKDFKDKAYGAGN